MDFRINSRPVTIDIDLRTSLLDLLRDHLGLTGSKKGCNQGACGACTVLVDGERINACLALAVQYQAREITTVEGLADGDELRERMSGNLCRCGAYNGIVAAIAETFGNDVRAEPVRQEKAA
jgi:aerobic-type carbon monoxide dehydrogenase small subunit (CoxS/CutS family)